MTAAASRFLEPRLAAALHRGGHCVHIPVAVGTSLARPEHNSPHTLGFRSGMAVITARRSGGSRSREIHLILVEIMHRKGEAFHSVFAGRPEGIIRMAFAAKMNNTSRLICSETCPAQGIMLFKDIKLRVRSAVAVAAHHLGRDRGHDVCRREASR